MTGIPVHIPTNQSSRRADDRCLPWRIVEWNSSTEAGQGWARLTGREGEGDEYRGGKQPSLQQEEEREGKRKREGQGLRERQRDKNKGVNSG